MPLNENVERLKELFPENNRSNLKIVVAKGANHGADVSDELITLPSGNSYFHFFSIAPYLTVEIIDFLRTHNFIK